ncbi:MAG: alpha-L-rhamnosidase [Eubacteriales bacterium]|nr:alpha-L-rhamnosidase [Eubacteriales bacterium]
MGKAYWIWYPGDFEIHHGMMQNFSREERGFSWPAYWRIDDCRRNVRFHRTYELTQGTSFTVYAHCMGYLLVNGLKRRFGEKIECPAGKTELVIFAGAHSGVPGILVEGETIYSDASWTVSDFTTPPVTVGWNERYTRKEQDPSVWVYETKEIEPVSVTRREGGALYDFGQDWTATLRVEPETEAALPLLLCYGESEQEALDTENCYYSQELRTADEPILRRAFRYVYLPEMEPGAVKLTAVHEYVDIPVRASFSSEDPQITAIWEASVRTFQLCSGIFFIDGIKRDRWIWSGDAYQSYFVNQYLFFDEDINRRTMWALRGNDPIGQHINTIVDYSMYWVIGVLNHYRATLDLAFVRAIYPKVRTMMAFLESQLDGEGFLVGRPGDWIFIDWADLDKDGPLCAEQMLLVMCYRTMAVLGEVAAEAGRTEPEAALYNEKAECLWEKSVEYYWDEAQGAFIDSFTSGKKHVTRHANIFAVLFGLADKEKTQTILRRVLLNPEIPQITTPYFKFYELEALCLLGERGRVLESIKAYWGGMLEAGATTIWEEYDPDGDPEKFAEMYGDPYGKSLCHAWGASPIYLIGRYFMGIRATADGYETFEVAPDLTLLGSFEAVFPVKAGTVRIAWDGETLRVCADREGGTLLLPEGLAQTGHVALEAGREVEVRRM